MAAAADIGEPGHRMAEKERGASTVQGGMRLD